jgi:hypothetical protein
MNAFPTGEGAGEGEGDDGVGEGDDGVGEGVGVGEDDGVGDDDGAGGDAELLGEPAARAVGWPTANSATIRPAARTEPLARVMRRLARSIRRGSFSRTG